MSKLFISIICFFAIYSTFSLNANQQAKLYPSSSIRCAPQLQKCLNAILKIPEARTLIDSISKDGAIQIIAKNSKLSKQFGAYWDPDQRVICINLSTSHDEGMVIKSLLFELHNASVNSKIIHLNNLAHNKKINKNNYIESMEYLEYINSLNASKISEIGIKMGVLPPGSKLSTYSSFKEHFEAQKMSGHSSYFAENYDNCLLFN
jgi:hypothetical protein